MAEKVKLNLKALAERERSLLPGHRACAGCGFPAILRIVLSVTEDPIIVVNATGCMEVVTSIFPYDAWPVTWVHNAKPARSFPFTVAQAAGALLQAEPALREEALILLGGAMPFLPPEERAFYFYFLFEAMEANDHRVRMAAFGVLMKLGPQAEEFIPYIKKMLGNGRPETRKTAVRVLLSIGTPKATALLEQVAEKDPDPDVRHLAGRMLEALR